MTLVQQDNQSFVHAPGRQQSTPSLCAVPFDFFIEKLKAGDKNIQTCFKLDFLLEILD